MAIQIHDVSHYLDTARRLAEQVAIDADRIDAERQLPTELANEMADEGLFRLLLPRSFGGVEMEHPDFLNILEVFSGVDASTAWCLNQNNVFSTSSSRMPTAIVREIWDDPRGVVTNGPPTAASMATPTPGDTGSAAIGTSAAAVIMPPGSGRWLRWGIRDNEPMRPATGPELGYC